MATSKNAVIQKLMDEVDSLQGTEENIEEKLQRIAEAVAAEQQKMHSKKVDAHADNLVDPQDAFACEGCQ